MKMAYLLIILLLLPLIFPISSATAQEQYPVPYAQITLVDRRSGKSLTLVTNSSGQAEADVVLSPHIINVSTMEGYLPYSANYTPPGDINVVLKNGVVLKGVIKDSEGNPQSGVTLTANISGCLAFTTTDDQGRYLFLLPANVDDNVTIYGQYFDFQLMMIWLQYFTGMNLSEIMEYFSQSVGFQLPGLKKGLKDIFLFSPKPITERGIVNFKKKIKINSTINELNITAKSSLYIEGYVLSENGEPIPNALVYSSGDEGFLLAITDENGYYRLNYNIEVGQHVIISAICPGYVESKFEIANINEDKMVNLTLTRSANLTVTVTDLNGNPVKGATVVVTAGNHTVVRITNDKGKAFINMNLPEGIASVFASKPEWNTFANAQVELSLGKENSVELSLNVILGLLEGVVTANGEPISGLVVSATATTAFGIYWSSTITDENGHYELYLPVYDMMGNTLKYNVTVNESYYYNSSSIADITLSSSETTTVNFEVGKKETVHIVISVRAEPLSVEYNWLEYSFKAKILNKELTVQVKTNSSILFGLLSFAIYQDKGMLGLAIQGPTHTTGELTITIPKELMSPPYMILLDNGTANFLDISQDDYENFVEIHLKYSHSIHYITIESSTYIPEFGYSPIAASIIIMVSLAVIIYLRKYH